MKREQSKQVIRSGNKNNSMNRDRKHQDETGNGNGEDRNRRGPRPKKKKLRSRIRKKLVVLFTFVLLAFGVLIIRLVLINRENGTQYQKQILAQQKYDSTTLPYRRGDILDANGIKLATSEKVYNLVIDAKVMTSKLDGKMQYLEPTLQALDKYFDLDINAIRQYVMQNQDSSWYVPLRKLTYDQIKDFKTFRSTDENKKLIKGVEFEEEYKRIYPNGCLAADVIGFYNADQRGTNGLEEYYDDVLKGTNGREFGYLNEELMLERTVKPAVDGYSIHSTIDANVQEVAEKYIAEYMEEHKNQVRSGNGAENVGCIVQKVNTGEILAMASAPTFDLNDIRNQDRLLGSVLIEQITNAAGYFENRKTGQIIDQAVLDSLDEDQLYLNLNQLWKNFCVSTTYEPGSVAKPFTVAAALEQGTISPNSTFECSGAMEIGGYKIKCHNGAEGTVTLENAIAKSCNVAMMKVAQTLGAERFCNYQQIFNFGLKTNVDLAAEARTASLVYNAAQMGPTDLATNSFGQNFNVTMIQMITGFSSLINGGFYYEPHMVSKITNSAGATVKNIEPRVLKQTVSEDTSALIRQYCEAVVDYGTGKTAKPAGYRIGGKTGTAETIDENTHKRSKDEYVVSFMGYAPADDPQIAVYVVVDRANAARQDDAKFATRIVRNVLTEILPYLNIYITEELSDSEKEELEKLHIDIKQKYEIPDTVEEGDETVDSRKDGTGQGSDAEQGSNSEQGSAPEHEEGDSTALPYGLQFPVDPATGYRVDPATGYKYDPEEGFLVEGDESSMGESVPVNPNLQ